MKRLINVIMLVVLALLGAGLQAQNPGIAPSQGAGQAGTPGGNVVRITSPRSGERVRQSYINVQFELINSGASAAAVPNFQLKLDSQDPVTTNSTNYTFTGLNPGAHTITVQLVDANGTPLAGARNEIQFVVLQPAGAPTPGETIALRHRRQPTLIAAAMRVEEPKEQEKESEGALPAAAGALPLLSVIGFGVLLGGIASAMKTRK